MNALSKSSSWNFSFVEFRDCVQVNYSTLKYLEPNHCLRWLAMLTHSVTRWIRVSSSSPQNLSYSESDNHILIWLFLSYRHFHHLLFTSIQKFTHSNCINSQKILQNHQFPKKSYHSANIRYFRYDYCWNVYSKKYED